MREEAFAAAIANWSFPPPHRRFGIYRNNVAAALINALRVRFPVTEQLVGREFFAAMAGTFADANRPASPVLISYGANFPDFVRSFPPSAGIAYLGDVAALESLWWQAYHAADEDPLSHAQLNAVDPARWADVRFRFHPSLGLLSSPHAAGSIWQAHHGGPGMASIDVAVPQRVLVARPRTEVMVTPISDVSHEFVALLSHGMKLGEAVDQALQHHPDLDLGQQLQGLIALNIITGLIS